MCFLFSINDVHPDFLSSPGELFSFLILFHTRPKNSMHVLNNYQVLTVKLFLIKVK